jgi:hypothetical protein
MKRADHYNFCEAVCRIENLPHHVFRNRLFIVKKHLMRLMRMDAAVAFGVIHVLIYFVENLLLLQLSYNCDE